MYKNEIYTLMKKNNFKYFFLFLNHSDNNIKLLHIKLPKLYGSTKCFEKLKYILFMVSEKHEKY